jgi:hypothetical protein
MIAYLMKTVPAKHACSTLPAMDRTANPAGKPDYLINMI